MRLLFVLLLTLLSLVEASKHTRAPKSSKAPKPTKIPKASQAPKLPKSQSSSDDVSSSGADTSSSGSDVTDGGETTGDGSDSITLDVDDEGRNLPLIAFEYTTSSKATHQQSDLIELTRVTTELLDDMFEMHFKHVERVHYDWTEVGRYSALAHRIVKFGVQVHFKLPQRIPSTSEVENVAKVELLEGSDFNQLYLERLQAMNSDIYRSTTKVRFIHEPAELEKALEESTPKFWEQKIVLIPLIIAAACFLLTCCLVCFTAGRDKVQQVQQPRDIEKGGRDDETMTSDFRTCAFSDEGASQFDKKSASDSTPKAKNKSIVEDASVLEEVPLEDIRPNQKKPSVADSLRGKIQSFKESAMNTPAPFVHTISFSSEKEAEVVKIDPPEEKEEPLTLFQSVRDIVAKKNATGTSNVAAIASAFSSKKSSSFNKPQPRPLPKTMSPPSSFNKVDARSATFRSNSPRSSSPFDKVQLRSTSPKNSRPSSPFEVQLRSTSPRPSSPFGNVDLKPVSDMPKRSVSPSSLNMVELKPVQSSSSPDSPRTIQKPLVTPGLLGQVELKSIPIQSSSSGELAPVVPTKAKEISPAKRQKTEATNKSASLELKQKYKQMLASKDPKPNNLVDELKMKLKDRSESSTEWKDATDLKKQKKEETPEWKKKFKEMGLKKDDSSL